MVRANDLSNFTFRFNGRGRYKVTYKTPMRGDYWTALVTDRSTIDATKNADWAKVKDIKRLMFLCKQGTHYRKNGEVID